MEYLWGNYFAFLIFNSDDHLVYSSTTVSWSGSILTFRYSHLAIRKTQNKQGDFKCYYYFYVMQSRITTPIRPYLKILLFIPYVFYLPSFLPFLKFMLCLTPSLHFWTPRYSITIFIQRLCTIKPATRSYICWSVNAQHTLQYRHTSIQNAWKKTSARDCAGLYNTKNWKILNVHSVYTHL